ncbi:tetratricopeptide repeat protein, partial [Luminiphilus sp.]|nr:tetratricopeptide repeat protein [Luminiphilus sp.]
DAHNNLGITLKELGRLDEAEANYRQAIALKPDYAEAHNNLGNSLQELGRLDEAEASCRQAIVLEPDLAGAHNNLGVALQELGRLGEAKESYEQALALQSDLANAQNNLVGLLTIYTSQTKSSQLIVTVDQEIKGINLNENTSGGISDDEVIYLFYKSSNIIKKHGLKLGTELSQTYRNNSVDLNCDRHMKIFDTFNVIPEFCFGCYKVQVEPRSILELIKLFVVFDQIKLPHNNTRKCMIEMRSEIAGFYKGLIYCANLKEAYQIADYLEMVIKEKIGSGLPLTVKRGCSEYSVAFPNYKQIHKSGSQPMNYDRNWKRIEDDFDSKNSMKPKSNIPPTLFGLSLSDVLIIRNWIDYAKGIGDPSVKSLKQNEVGSQSVYEIAKSRLETYVKRKPLR